MTHFSILILGVLQQFVYARVSNYTWAYSTLRARDLFGIRLAILFSCGLLIPWAKVRYTRCLLANLSITVESDREGFVATKE